MFVLYAIPIGILVGYLLGGRLDRLSSLRLRWVPLILFGLLVQVAIFTDAGGRLVGDAGPAIYVASTATVLGGGPIAAQSTEAGLTIDLAGQDGIAPLVVSFTILD